MASSDSVEVVHNPSRNRFEATVDGQLCRLEYRMHDGVMNIHHTEVPAALGGRGLGGMLVAAALAYARANALKVMTTCSYARAWINRHPESLDLLARP